MMSFCIFNRRLVFIALGTIVAWFLVLSECSAAVLAPRLGFSAFKQDFFARYGQEGASAPIPRSELNNPESYPDQFVSELELQSVITACKNMLKNVVGGLAEALIVPGLDVHDAAFSYIQKKTVIPDDRIFVIGDLHGSAHAFIKNLENIGIHEDMSLPSPSEILIFTGDLIQKGRFGIENVYLAARLMLANPGRVFWVRGNHETRRVILRDRYGFNIECKRKLSSENWEKILCEFLQLFDLLPSALYVGNQSLFIQVCHSGIYANVERIGLLKIPVVIRDDNFCKMVSDFLRSDATALAPVHDYSRFMYNGFNNGGGVAVDPKNPYFYRFPIGDLNPSLLPDNVRVVFRAHQHNGKSVSRMMANDIFSELPDQFITSLWFGRTPVVYTFMSCPEGMGGNDPELLRYSEENCNVRGYGMITVGSASDASDWTIKKFEWR